jgi:type I restriction-modification system DNA methylase subunit
MTKFEEFYNFIENSVFSLYKSLNSTTNEYNDSLVTYRCSVALVFDLFSLELIGKQLIKINKNNWGKTIIHCETFKNEINNLSLKIDKNSIDYVLVNKILCQIRSKFSSNDLKLEYITSAFEITFGLLPDKNGDILSSQNKRATGVYYTPVEMVEHVVFQTFVKNKITFNSIDSLLRFKVIDPATGTGLFLLSCANYLAKELCKLDSKIPLLDAKVIVVENCLHGVDIDPMATNICRSILSYQTEGRVSNKILKANIKTGDSLLGYTRDALNSFTPDVIKDKKLEQLLIRVNKKSLNSFSTAQDEYFSSLLHIYKKSVNTQSEMIFSPFCWEHEFPRVFSGVNSGFDLVIGNPPWGKIKANIKEFYSHLSPIISETQGDKLREFVDLSMNE